MPMQLQVVAGPDKGRVFPINEAVPLLIGRSQDSETRPSNPHASRTHCQVQVDGDAVVIIDRGSAAGTLVNGKKITQQQLRHGDVIRVGDTQIRFESDEGDEKSTLAPGAAAPARPPAGGAERLNELVGKTLSRYEVGQVLAKGNSGLVFGARDTREDRVVALKVLWPEL